MKLMSKKPMTTTCLINNYNYARFVGEAIEGALCQLAARIGFEVNRTDLHVDDGLVTVSALGCGRQADHILRLDLGENPFK